MADSYSSMNREIFEKIKRIEIRSRRLVNEAMGGEYHSVFKGRGVEFDEVRQYRYGDDIRTIDWNVTARLGSLHVKRFVEERELTVMLAVDLSASKNFGSAVRLKNELAAELAAVLAFSAIRNHDRVGALIFTARAEKFIPPRKGRTHVLRLIREILAYEPTCGRTSIETALRFLNNVVRKRCVLFLISDFIDTGYEKVLRAVNVRHDLIALPIGDLREMELPFVGILQLIDPETGQVLHVDTRQRGLLQQYQDLAKQDLAARNQLFKKYGIDYLEVFTHKSYDVDLVRFFRQRAMRMR
jgi:uncharacterized protein (DUF58 family)